MGITLGAVTFDEVDTTVRETHEEVGGRDARTIELAGVIAGESCVADIEARLDAIVAAAPEDGCGAALVLREGRRLLVRRTGFSREVARESLVGSFVLELAADDPFEESAAERSEDWAITGSGDTKAVSPGGTAPALARITLVATGDVVNPSFGDGTRTIRYEGVVADGEALVFDGVERVVRLAGADVTAYAPGKFPLLSPDGTTLTYTDDESSSHTAAATVVWRDRWY